MDTVRSIADEFSVKAKMAGNEQVRNKNRYILRLFFTRVHPGTRVY